MEKTYRVAFLVDGGGASRLACGETFGFNTGRRALGEGSLGD
jgi:hypothetical protein